MFVHDVLRQPHQDRSTWGRGVLASYEDVTPPSRRASDVEQLEQRVLILERMMNTHTLQLATPMDVTKLQFTTRTVVAVVVMCVGLFAGQLGLNTRLESNVMNAITSNAKIQDERYVTMQKAIESLRNRVELSQIEFNTFKENLLRDRRR